MKFKEVRAGTRIVNLKGQPIYEPLLPFKRSQMQEIVNAILDGDLREFRWSIK